MRPRQDTEIRVGQWVYLPFSPEPAKAQVLEDRGPLGIDGEHVFLVLVTLEEGVEPFEREVAERHLLLAV
jgi:hypothetical protein